jgi:hypothetical protein
LGECFPPKIKVGALGNNHNQKLRIKSRIKAGILTINHNHTVR